ncbi:DUF2798 domain-containing protein [Polaribacter cellanae]|uniref:DUF2798 domain-containing protein n=1 Tax=Polaribacter cellanae TaxID=2818493 RepID=A0A975CMB2_9FLAO|nr:DUF2798 domain-containing protein [Polaribacter cellanae]QTE21850.1 DUF2798 domain-containing protein [Polaribacter cellanae]
MSDKFYKYINTVLVTVPMRLIMAFVGISHNYGFKEGWVQKFIETTIFMFPIAYLSVLILVPIARKLTDKIVGKKDSD